jgi:hypothetical protein
MLVKCLLQLNENRHQYLVYILPTEFSEPSFSQRESSPHFVVNSGFRVNVSSSIGVMDLVFQRRGEGDSELLVVYLDLLYVSYEC